mmetsp:Transcript_56982/g.90262  ORF Transcript_56982/g.90262 Transcript_56982/m.90262 type:complete len:493 (-) Transcript_56982:87-1565(-)
MTQLDDELEEAIWAEYHTGDSDGGSDNAGNDGYHDFRVEGIDDASPNFSLEEDAHLEELIETLQGIPAGDVIDEAKDALKKSGREPTDANLLAVLLKIFRIARDAALDGCETWEHPVSYCEILTGLCDRNFTLGSSSGSFPPSFVGIVYAECGRTLLLADQLKKSRELLEKSVYAFGLVADQDNEATQRQNAAAVASLARVMRRLDGADVAHVQFLKALEIYSKLPEDADTADFLLEICEMLGDMEQVELSSSALGVLAEIAEEKFGIGSEEHLKVLKQVADTARALDKLELAASALACRANVLQTSSVRPAGIMSYSEVCGATEEAAAALEAALPAKLQKGDLEGAIAVWEEAIGFRELLEGSGSKLVAEMQNALRALRQALARQDSSLETEMVDDDTIEAPMAETTTVENWDDDIAEVSTCVATTTAPAESTEQSKSSNPNEKASNAPVSLTASLLAKPSSLRPSWMKDSAKPKAHAKAKSDAPNNDAWD